MNLRTLWLVSLAFALFLTGCSDDDDSDSGPSSPSTGYSFIATPIGSNIEITFPNGDPMPVGNDFVSDGFSSGQLLNLNYWRQITIGTSEGSFFLRWNFPQDISAADTIAGTFDLFNFPLLLQDTGNLDEIIVEFTKPGTQDGEFLDGNSSGEITLLRDVNTNIGVYSMVGEIDATFVVNGQETRVAGTFWNEDFNW